MAEDQAPVEVTVTAPPPKVPSVERAAAADIAMAKKTSKADIDTENRFIGDIRGLESQRSALKSPTLNLPEQPKPVVTDPVKAWGSAAMAFAAIGSLFTRQHMTAALSAGAKALQAFHQGDIEATNLAFKQYQQAQESAIEQYNFERNTYNDLIANIEAAEKLKGEERDAALRSSLAAMQATATTFQDAAMLENVKNAKEELAIRREGVGAQFAQIGVERQRLALEMQEHTGDIEQQMLQGQILGQLKNDPKFQNALKTDPMQAMMMLRQTGFKMTPAQENTMALSRQKALSGSVLGKAYSETQQRGQTIDAAAQTIKAGHQLNSMQQAALQDSATRILTGGAIRQFTLKLNTEHAGLGDQAQVLLNSATTGGNLSRNQQINLINVVKEYENMVGQDYAKSILAEQQKAASLGVDPQLIVPDDAQGLMEDYNNASPVNGADKSDPLGLLKK